MKKKKVPRMHFVPLWQYLCFCKLAEATSQYTESNYAAEGRVRGGRHCERLHCVSSHTDVSQHSALLEPWEP